MLTLTIEKMLNTAKIGNISASNTCTSCIQVKNVDLFMNISEYI